MADVTAVRKRAPPKLATSRNASKTRISKKGVNIPSLQITKRDQENHVTVVSFPQQDFLDSLERGSLFYFGTNLKFFQKRTAVQTLRTSTLIPKLRLSRETTRGIRKKMCDKIMQIQPLKVDKIREKLTKNTWLAGDSNTGSGSGRTGLCDPDLLSAPDQNRMWLDRSV